jgi:glycosyltransferase involved in cell wall biosynthesis
MGGRSRASAIGKLAGLIKRAARRRWLRAARCGKLRRQRKAALGRSGFGHGQGRFMKVSHVLNGLAIGGMERAALRLARRGLDAGDQHELLLYDTPFRDTAQDFDPGAVPVTHLRRGKGLDLRFALRLAAHLRQQRSDVVHAHNATALVYAALAARLALPRRPRLVGTFHTWPSHATGRARLLCRVASQGAAVAAVSDELGARLREAGWTGRCETIWNGVDTRAFTPQGGTDGWRGRLGIGADAFVVGHVARFDAIKRHEDMLAAAQLLADRRPGVVVVLVGRGPLLAAMRGRAAGLVNLRFVESVIDMPPLLRSLDAIALCSSHEAAPLCLLEGMACGLPVVATAVGGVPHLVGTAADQAAGLLVPPHAPQALAAAMARLHDDHVLRARLAGAARARAEGFSFEEEWRQYQARYGNAA